MLDCVSFTWSPIQKEQRIFLHSVSTVSYSARHAHSLIAIIFLIGNTEPWAQIEQAPNKIENYVRKRRRLGNVLHRSLSDTGRQYWN